MRTRIGVVLQRAGRIASVLAFLPLVLFAKTKYPARVVFPGEELLYEVSYLGIPLGTIRVVTYGWDTLQGEPVLRARAFIDSHPNIPFVALHAIFDSWIDRSLAFSRQFQGKTKVRDSAWAYNFIAFDYSGHKVVIENGIGDTVWKHAEYRSTKRWNDGFSLFFLARKYLRLGKSVAVPTIIDFDTTKTIFYFYNQPKVVEISAVPYPVRTRYFEGKALWKGIYGLSGEFRGWFSDDEASIPIYAQMKVYLGAVDIELVKWQRADWQPPKAESK